MLTLCFITDGFFFPPSSSSLMCSDLKNHWCHTARAQHPLNPTLARLELFVGRLGMGQYPARHACTLRCAWTQELPQEREKRGRGWTPVSPSHPLPRSSPSQGWTRRLTGSVQASPKRFFLLHHETHTPTHPSITAVFVASVTPGPGSL